MMIPSTYRPHHTITDQCAHCGAPKDAHGPAPERRCDPDAVAYSDLLGNQGAPRAAAESPRDGQKTRIGIAIAIVGGLITIGAGISSCVNSGINYRAMRALEKMTDHQIAAPAAPVGSMRRAPSGQVEALIDDAWIATKLWIRPDGNVQIIAPIGAVVPKDGHPFTEIAPMTVIVNDGALRDSEVSP